MEIGRKIVKVLIVILEGCVVRLKDIEIYLDGKDDKGCLEKVSIEKVKPINSTISTSNNVKNESFDREQYYNISLLDDFVKSIGLSIGPSFMTIIQQVELTTEYNIIATIVDILPDIEKLNAIYNSLKNSKYIEFAYISPSPIRKKENKVVDRNFIENEMKELGLIYDSNSLYDNSLRVIEARQKDVVVDFIYRFNDIIVKVLKAKNDVEKQKRTIFLKKELEDRRCILDIKLKR